MSSPTSQTPPPPQMYSTPAPLASEPTGPGLTEPQRLINTFIAPSKTFEDIRRNASWWVPWLISAIFTIAAAFVMMQKIDFPHLAQHRMEQSKFGQRQLENSSPADRDRIIRVQAGILKGTLFVRPVFGLLFGLLGAAILMAVYNFILGAEVPFQRAMAVLFYASLPSLIKIALLCLSLWFSADPGSIDPDINPVATNPAFFMDPQGNKFLYGLASGIDVIAIWVTILLAIGFAKASSNRKPSLSTSMVTMFAIYGILVLGGAALSAAF